MKRFSRLKPLALLCILIAMLGGMLTHFGCVSNDKYQSFRLENEQNKEYARSPRGSSPGGQTDMQYKSNQSPIPSVTNGTNLNDNTPSFQQQLRNDYFRDADELWIIEKRPAMPPQSSDDLHLPGCGALFARDFSDSNRGDWTPANPNGWVPSPLQHTDVRASISGPIAAVDVVQKFANPFAVKIEAVYVFPLPSNAAITDFIMTIGDRKIRGVIREREQAKQIYEAARAQGLVASLLTQERPNIFTQRVANIEPNHSIDVQIHYFNTLPVVDGEYEFAFPMVVGPRFNPPGSTTGIGAANARATPNATGQPTQVNYLKPTQRSGADISLQVNLNNPVPLGKIKCISHDVQTDRLGQNRAIVTLDHSDSIPNKDFVLRFKPDDSKIQSGAVAFQHADGGYIALMITPPADQEDLRPIPMEVIFTLDVSGSMNGQPTKQAKDALRYALKHLGEDDTFNVIKFSDRTDKCFNHSMAAKSRNIKEALDYLDRSNGEGGGTMMLDGIRAALADNYEDNRLRVVAFFTDGYIGNETDILSEINRNIGQSRIFSFGVGSSVNRYLLESMARVGKGAAAFLTPNDDGYDIVANFLDRASRPAMSRIAINAPNCEFFPKRIPDLYAGRPIMLVGRYAGTLPRSLNMTGRLNGEVYSANVPVTLADNFSAESALKPLFARAQISDLLDQMDYGQGNHQTQIRNIALQNNLLSPWTAFLAVDASRKTEGNFGITTPVPVPMPDGVKYDTTVP